VESKLPLIHLNYEKTLFTDSKFDLNGTNLQSTSANFHPSINMENCTENGNCSKVTGFTVDVVDK
jgi:MinD superfamily P-loop ATPase